jgi:tRNA (Thr-GGU) A37 N-methylase
MDKNRIICSECGQEVNKDEVCMIDDKAVCLVCIYGDVNPLEIFPIGKVTTNLQPHELETFAPGSKKVSRIDLLPSQKRFMYKLEEEPFLLIVYYLHKVNSVRSVFNRRLDGKRVGVFAARTPYRLSKIAVSEVKLLKIEGHTLYVEGLDAIDGSPVLDIKLGLRHGDLSGR